MTSIGDPSCGDAHDRDSEKDEADVEKQFFNAVRPALHSICRKLLEKKNFSGLRIILKSEGDDVLSALNKLCGAGDHMLKTPAGSPGFQLQGDKTDGCSAQSDRSITEITLNAAAIDFLRNNSSRIKPILDYTGTCLSWKADDFGHALQIHAKSSESRKQAEVLFVKLLSERPHSHEILISSGGMGFNLSDIGEFRLELFKRTGTNMFCFGFGTEETYRLKADSTEELEKGKLLFYLKVNQARSGRVAFVIAGIKARELAKSKMDFKKLSQDTETSITFAKVDERSVLFIRGSNTVQVRNALKQIGRIAHIERVGSMTRVVDGEIISEEPYVYSDSEHETTDADPQINDNDWKEKMLQSFPDDMTILFLGETGAGKSTVINSLVNYLKHMDIDSAAEDPTVLIKSSFTLTKTDARMTQSVIVTEPTLEYDGCGHNEVLKPGASATQDPKVYLFSWKLAGQSKSIKIIDTPGIGDVRGIDYDKKNFDKILSYIADFSELHAICVLIQPNAARLTPAFRFCIDELLVHLHHSAAKNIIFCFSGTRCSFYRPGETYPTLLEHLERLKLNRNIEIPLNEKTMFCFDNEGFRYICGVRNGYRFTENQRRQYAKSYSISAKETQRMFAEISKIPAHKVNDTLCLNNTRALILALAGPLAEISKTVATNMRMLEEKYDEIQTLKRTGGDLRGQLYMDQEIIEAVEVDYPKTVCAAAKCTEMQKFHPGHPNMQVVYKTVCHDRCYLKGVQTERMNNVNIRECETIDPYTENCENCGCSWSVHVHIRYHLNRRITRIVDEEVQKSINDKDSGVQAAQLFLKKMSSKLDDLRKESKKIMEYSAIFSTYLNKNSIIPYNDSYSQYLEYLLHQERNKAEITGDQTMIEHLEKNKREYEEQVKILKQADSGDEKFYSVEEINLMIEELKRMSNGTTLNEIQRLEILSVRQIRANESVYVPLGTNFFTTVVGGLRGGWKRIRKRFTLTK